MKICPECHKLSKDDDFCSYCGAAVFTAEDYTDSASIDCNRYDRGHEHRKVTYDISEKGTTLKPPVRDVHEMYRQNTPPVQNRPQISADRPSQSGSFPSNPTDIFLPERMRRQADPEKAQEAEQYINDLLNGKKREISQRDKKVLTIVIIIVLIIVGQMLFAVFAAVGSLFSAIG